jgi:FkbM family methyltransferase
MRMRSNLKRLLNSVGIDVRLTRNIARAEERRKVEEWRRPWQALRSLCPVRTVIDVGANAGQFAAMIHGVFPDAAILSFEPLPECQEPLRRILRDMPGSKAFQTALGAEAGAALFRRASFSPCSSVLRPNDRLKAEVGDLTETSTLEVPFARLDDILEPFQPASPLLIKLDVQGYEKEVMEGAPKTLAVAAIVVLEVAFVPLYEKQPLFDDLYQRLRDRGFSYRGNLAQNVSRVDGVITEADALFMRQGTCT